MSTLFDLDEITVEWIPILRKGPSFNRNGLPFDTTTTAYQEWLNQEDLCRDCGDRARLNAGGAQDGYSHMVCDGCTQLDGCLSRKHDDGPEWHISRWGKRHPASTHDDLMNQREKRRAKYRKSTT